MSGPAPSDPPRSAVGALSPGRLQLFLGPVIVTLAVAGVASLAAALAGWRREEMLYSAAILAVAAAVPAAIVVLRGLHVRQEAQRELLNMRARVGGIVESAMDAIITVNSNQRVVQFNPAAERAFGHRREAILGRPLDVLIPERFRAGHRSHVDRFGHTNTSSRSMGAQAVLHGLRADGSEFPIEASISQHTEDGGERYFTVILRDVTERVRAGELLARSEARLRGILDSAMDAVITIDESQRIVLFNAAAEEVFGWPRAEALGAPLDELIPGAQRASHAAHVRRFGRGHEPSRRMGRGARVVTGLRRNGEEFPIEASISQVTEGGQQFYTVILRDVTERVRAEEALQRSRREIHDLARAASQAREQEKSRIARELHDELGQALTALKIDVGWLRESLAGAPEPVARKLASMQVLLDGTVASARRISADLRPLMLDDLGLTAAAEWLVENFRNRTGIACELALGASGLDLPDPHATTVFRVLQECLTNVAKHAEATQVEVSLAREDGHVTLTVSDNGRGFDTGAPRPGGSFGLLGLRERALLIDGQVSLEAAPGRGTRVELRIPAPETEGSEA